MRKPKKFGFYGLEYAEENKFIFNDKYKASDNSFEVYKQYKYEYSLYYDYDKRLWVHYLDYTGSIFPAIAPVHSLKAAKKHLKRHNEIPKGTVFRFVSKYVGCDIKLVKE